MQLAPAFVAISTLAAIACAQDLPAAVTVQNDSSAFPEYTTMTSAQRWNDFVSGSLFGPSVGLKVFASAAISHLNHEPDKWRLGSRGYFERAGSHYARGVVQGCLHDGIAAALGHDTRYFREPGKSGWHRAGHALRRTLFTRDRSGRSVFDISEITSLYTAPMIASAWRPRHQTPLTQGLRGGDFGVGAQAVGNLFREFGPDLKRMFKK